MNNPPFDWLISQTKQLLKCLNISDLQKAKVSDNIYVGQKSVH